ncbi:MAG TPA: hypothetical protein VJ874_05005 [Candidatus Thermoplasmatota archaeon]|nr:hypothetical protein [Candidatus Thermoplasmatota archaeon]
MREVGLDLAPATVAGLACAVLGLGLVASAFLGEGFGVVRLFLGLGLLVTGMITAGLQLLLGKAAPTKPTEET